MRQLYIEKPLGCLIWWLGFFQWLVCWTHRGSWSNTQWKHWCQRCGHFWISKSCYTRQSSNNFVSNWESKLSYAIQCAWHLSNKVLCRTLFYCEDAQALPGETSLSKYSIKVFHASFFDRYLIFFTFSW